MKILRIYTKLPPLRGGMEKHILKLTQYQLKSNHDVKIFYNDGERITSNDEKICKIKLYKLKPQAIGLIIFYGMILLKVSLRKQEYDVIHIHGDWSSLLFVRLLRKRTNAKLVVLTLHDQLTPKYTHQKLLPQLIQNIDLILSTGYDTANELEKLSGKNVLVQPSGIDKVFFERFKKNFRNNRFTVVTVANLFPKKNIELILDIAKVLNDLRFIVVGEGGHRDALEYVVKKYKIRNVKFVGFKNTEDVRRIYMLSDCYLLTSHAEGTPTSALEAVACGLPIISSNAGGLGNIIKENINGFIINDFIKELYVEKIKFVKNNMNFRKKVYERNVALAQSYRWDNVGRKITDIIEKKLSEQALLRLNE